MFGRTLTTKLGKLSDRITIGFLLRHNRHLPRFEVSEEVMGRIRLAQLEAILAITTTVMLVNIVNGLALLALDFSVHGMRPGSIMWLILLTGLTVLSAIRRVSRAALEKAKLSPRGPGAVVLHSFFLCMLWCYPPVFMLINASPEQFGFVSAVNAGMVAGGALVLYPVPLAALVFSTLMIVIGTGALVYHDSGVSLHYVIVSISFITLVYHAISKHAVLFLAELLRKEEAEAQRDVIALLMGDYEHASGAWLWRCDAGLLLEEVAPGLMTALSLEETSISRMPLRGLLGRAGAAPVTDEDGRMLSMLSGPPHALPPQFDMQVRVQAGTPRERVMSLFVRRSIAENGLIIGYEGFTRDITEEHHAKEAARYLATHDVMTGLLNSVSFHEAASKRLREFNATSKDKFAVFVFVDADNLKSVNDTNGHSAGDVLIKTIANRMHAILGESGLVTRKGGDEFLACVFDVEERDIDDLADAVLAAICRDFEHDGTVLELSCSMGVSRAPAGSASLQNLELEADRALYFAKHKGRSRLEHYNAKLGQKLVIERRIASDLPNAIRNREIRCEFQPIVNIDNGRIVGCEALVRWDHPELGTIPPEEVILAARHTHSAGALGSLILRRALEAVAAWPEGTIVSVNAMASELTERDYAARVSAALTQTGISPSQLSIEITESELLENSVQVIRNLTRLRKTGVRIAVDDFGAGYSSLNYLPQYPNDVIKIDRSLVRNSSKTDAGPLILNAVSTLTQALNVIAVAEGVETEEDLNTVRDAGFHLVQGYYFYKPMRQEELLIVFDRASQDFSARKASA